MEVVCGRYWNSECGLEEVSFSPFFFYFRFISLFLSYYLSIPPAGDAQRKKAVGAGGARDACTRCLKCAGIFEKGTTNENSHGYRYGSRRRHGVEFGADWVVPLEHAVGH